MSVVRKSKRHRMLSLDLMRAGDATRSRGAQRRSRPGLAQGISALTRVGWAGAAAALTSRLPSHLPPPSSTTSTQIPRTPSLTLAELSSMWRRCMLCVRLSRPRPAMPAAEACGGAALVGGRHDLLPLSFSSHLLSRFYAQGCLDGVALGL